MLPNVAFSWKNGQLQAGHVILYNAKGSFLFHFHFATFQVIKEVPEGRQTLLFTVFLAASEWWCTFFFCNSALLPVSPWDTLWVSCSNF